MYKYINYFRVQENRYCVSSSPIFPFLFLSSYFSHFFLFSYFSHFSSFPPPSIFHGSFLCAEESPVLVSTGNINFPRRGRSPSALWTLVNNSRQIQFPFSDTRTRFKSQIQSSFRRRDVHNSTKWLVERLLSKARVIKDCKF